MQKPTAIHLQVGSSRLFAHGCTPTHGAPQSVKGAEGHLQARSSHGGERASPIVGHPGVLHHLMQAHALLWLLHQDLHATLQSLQAAQKLQHIVHIMSCHLC